MCKTEGKMIYLNEYMAITTQKTGGYDIVANGTAFTFKNNPLDICFTDKAALDKVDISGGVLTIKINFIEDKSQDGKIHSEPVGENIINITIYYSGTSIIGGSSEPLRIAKNGDKSMYFSIGFQKYNESFLSHYTVFVGE